MSKVPPPPGLLVPPPGLPSPRGAADPSGLVRSQSQFQLETLERKDSGTVASLDFFRAIQIRKQLEEFYAVYDSTKLNSASLDKFMLFIAQNSYDAFNAMLEKKYGANLDTRAGGTTLQQSIEKFYNVYDPSKLSGMPLFLEFIKANGLTAFNTMLLKKYGATLNIDGGRAASNSALESLDASAVQVQQTPSFAFEYSAQEMAEITLKLENFYVQRDPTKLNPESFHKFKEFIKANGEQKFNQMLFKKYAFDLNTVPKVLDDDIPPPPDEDEENDAAGKDDEQQQQQDPSNPMANKTQLKQLDQFFKWKYPSAPAKHAELLLSKHPLYPVADAVRAKLLGVPTGWRPYLGKPVPAYEPKLSDRKIDEVLDTEDKFVRTIKEVQSKYMARIREIFSGSDAKDKEWQRCFGLTQNECRQIFSKLEDVVLFSEELLVKLDVINWVRTPPKTGEGRAIHLGNAFIAMAPKLHVYAPIIALYQTSIKALAEAEKRVTRGGQYKNFLEEWEDMCNLSDVLKGQQMQAVLITPMQRVPRYKMLLEQIVKDCDHPDALPVVQKALDLFSEGASQINESVRTYEKMEAFLGVEGAKEVRLLRWRKLTRHKALLTGQLMTQGGKKP